MASPKLLEALKRASVFYAAEMVIQFNALDTQYLL
jgi:hypothetical protein